MRHRTSRTLNRPTRKLGMGQNHFEPRTLFYTKIARTGCGIRIFGAVQGIRRKRLDAGYRSGLLIFRSVRLYTQRRRCRDYD